MDGLLLTSGEGTPPAGQIQVRDRRSGHSVRRGGAHREFWLRREEQRVMALHAVTREALQKAHVALLWCNIADKHTVFHKQSIALVMRTLIFLR